MAERNMYYCGVFDCTLAPPGTYIEGYSRLVNFKKVQYGSIAQVHLVMLILTGNQ